MTDRRDRSQKGPAGPGCAGARVKVVCRIIRRRSEWVRSAQGVSTMRQAFAPVAALAALCSFIAFGPTMAFVSAQEAAAPTASTQGETSKQSDEGRISVTESGSPAVRVDVFVIDGKGKQSLGTTNDNGQLAFEPTLLTGKTQVTVATRKCRVGTEVYLVSVATDDACLEVENVSSAGCTCKVVGPIWWGPFISVDLTSSLASEGTDDSIVRNPWLWVGAGAAAGTVIIAATSGDSGTASRTSDPIATEVPDAVTAVSGLSGTYNITVVEVDDPANHLPRIGNLPGFIEVFVNNRIFRATGPQPWVRVDGFITASDDFDAGGVGGVMGRSGVRVRFYGRIDPATDPFRITGWYEMGVNGELPTARPIRFRIEGTKR